MLGAAIAHRRCGHREVMVLERLFAAIFPRHEPPPVPVPPDVETTPPAERRRIDDRLKGAEAHLAELLSLAGLDELRGRHKDNQRAD